MDENKNTNINSNQRTAHSTDSGPTANSDQDTQIVELKRQISLAEESLEAAKRALFELTGDNPSVANYAVDHSTAEASSDGKIIEGIFNGENMVGPEGKIYPVPANYASKSKLVEGDRLKLTISDDGSFVFKQIAPVKRKSLIGLLKFENNAYHVLADGHSYSLLYASVTFHKAKPGDRVSIVVPESGESNWAVLESIIHDMPITDDKENAESITPPEVIPAEEKPLISIADEVEIKAPEAVIPNVNEMAPIAELAEEDAATQAKSKLDIDSIDINSPRRQEAPEAVNPGLVQNHQQPQVSPVTPQREETPQAITEMDI